RVVKGAAVMHDRPPEGRPHWEEGDDPDEDCPAWIEESASYDLVFLGPMETYCCFEYDPEEYGDDEDDSESVGSPSECRVGCAVGISTIAPLAVVHFTEKEWSEDGSETMPDIDPMIFDLNGSAVEPETHYKEFMPSEGIQALRALRTEIGQVLESFGIRVLSDAELRSRIPDLKPNPLLNPFPGQEQEFATLQDALFFRGV
ncbi:MAG: hypothetical protein L3K26_14210, partial [Candidatus Hydrogenedentes bacterium]|nr:hypothetical protein [Candidatus Hydrogenedentota bacterium]